MFISSISSSLFARNICNEEKKNKSADIVAKVG